MAVLEKQGIGIEEARANPVNRRLFRDREEEKARNLSEFKTAEGRALRYGMVLQLQHDTSFKYIRVSRLAPLGNRKGGFRVVLDRDAGETAWFRVIPRLKMHAEGEKVHAGDPVVLINEVTGMRLFVDSFQISEADPRHEVVGVPPKTVEQAPGLHLQLYRPVSVQKHGSDHLLTNQPIRLHHKELDGYVTVLGGYDTGVYAEMLWKLDLSTTQQIRSTDPLCCLGPICCYSRVCALVSGTGCRRSATRRR